jgi:pilus assembly protein CpaE
MPVAEESLRILLVSTADETRDQVERALADEGSAYRLYWVTQPDLALRRAEELMPQVVLVDESLAGARMAALIQDVAERVPGAVILALVSGTSLALAGQAVLAGARGFVTRPIRADDLLLTLRETLGRQRAAEPALATASRSGRVVVFCAPKGGTGRTTLAINTALNLLSLSKAPVALVDADYASPALDVALNLQPDRDITDLLPRLSRLDEELVNGVMISHASGLHVLLAPPPAALFGNTLSLPQVQQILVVLKRIFPLVVVDLGLPLDETAFAFLDGADRIVMSVLPEMVGLRNTRLMLDQFAERGYPREKIELVVNRADAKGGVAPRDIEARLRVVISEQIPDDQPLAIHAINRGVPVSLSHPRSALAQAYGRVAQHLLSELAGGQGAEALAPGQEEPGSRRLFSWRPARPS